MCGVNDVKLASFRPRARPSARRRARGGMPTRPWLALLLVAAPRSPSVVVDLFLMSQCPDAYRCEVAIAPALEQLGSLIELRLGFIAEVDASEPSGFRCPHGRGECEGNIIQLCVQKHYPAGAQSAPAHAWTRFLTCAGGTMHSNFSAIPGNTDSCLTSLGVPRSARRALRQCIEGREGRELHLHSVRRTHATCGHEATAPRQPCTSCQMFLDGKPSCSVDWGEWFNCTDPSPQGWIDRVCAAAADESRRGVGSALPAACQHRGGHARGGGGRGGRNRSAGHVHGRVQEQAVEL